MPPSKSDKANSKFLSLILRHQPETVGVELDENGWIDVDRLLNAINAHGNPLTRDDLQRIVAESDKQRFALDEGSNRIRANQGHSIDVELGYEAAIPREFLYHGTPEKFVDVILREGLKKMTRHHVHLSESIDIAGAVGARRGRPVVLRIDAQQMHAEGFEFFVTPNRVWLTDHVPCEYLAIAPDDR
ncbi:MAG: RNA 2'-phosphotransferase [Pirellulaceae bacterium]